MHIFLTNEQEKEKARDTSSRIRGYIGNFQNDIPGSEVRLPWWNRYGEVHD